MNRGSTSLDWHCENTLTYVYVVSGLLSYTSVAGELR